MRAGAARARLTIALVRTFAELEVRAGAGRGGQSRLREGRRQSWREGRISPPFRWRLVTQRRDVRHLLRATLTYVHKMPTLAECSNGMRQSGSKIDEAGSRFCGCQFDLRWARPLITAPSFRNDEERFVSTAEIDGYLYSVVWTWQQQNQRIISFRRASNAEEGAYQKAHG